MMMPDSETDDEPTELADKHDGASIARNDIQASVEYSVELTPEQLDELPETIAPADFAGDLATSRVTNAYDVSRMSVSAVVEDATDWDDDGRVFTVVVRV